MKQYGIPYMGSKSKIAEKIIDELPAGDVFVDLFGGGGAITHAAILSGKWKRFIYNDIDPIAYKGFTMAARGDFKTETRWIDRETFHRLKDSDPYVALCFSFGNRGRDYAYAKELEPWKKAVHYARVFGDFSEFERFGVHTDGTRRDIVKHKDEYKAAYIRWYMRNVMKSDREYRMEKAELEKNIKEESERLRAYLIGARDAAGLRSSDIDRHLGTNGMSGHYFGRSQWEFPTREAYIRMQEIMPELDKDFDEVVGLSTLWQSLQSLESLESLQSLQSLERLQSLESLQSLERLERLQSLESLPTQHLTTYNTSYDEIDVPRGAVVYCDIPYRGTTQYRGGGFDHERFYQWARSRPFDVYVSEYNMPADFCEVFSTAHRSTLSATANNAVTERLYCNHHKARWVQLSLFEEYA